MCPRYHQPAAQPAPAQQQPTQPSRYTQHPQAAQPDAQAQAQARYQPVYGQDASYSQQYAQQSAVTYEQPQVQQVPAAQPSYDQPQLVKLTGLPFDATKMDIESFFDGFTLSPGGIIINIVGNTMDQLTSEAWVTLTTQAEAQRCIAAKNGQYITTLMAGLVAPVHVFIE